MCSFAVLFLEPYNSVVEGISSPSPRSSSSAALGFLSHLAPSSLRIQAPWAHFYYTWQNILLRCWSVFKNSAPTCRWPPAANTGFSISLLSAPPVAQFSSSPCSSPQKYSCEQPGLWVQKRRTIDRKTAIRWVVAGWPAWFHYHPGHFPVDIFT